MILSRGGSIRRWLAKLLRRRSGDPPADPVSRPQTAAQPFETDVAPGKTHAEEQGAALWAALTGEIKTPSSSKRNFDDQILAQRILDHGDAHLPDPASLPAVAVRIVDLLEQPDANVEHLASWVAMDPAIAGRVLKIANSVMFRGGQDVHELPAAIVRLGLREVSQIAVAVAGRSLFDMQMRAELELFAGRWSRMFLDAMTTAYSASWLASELHCCPPERAFLAGMLHDVGRPIGLRSLAALLIEGQLHETPSPQRVDALLDDVHVTLGSDASAVWCLPTYLLAVCAHHHQHHLPADSEHSVIHVVRAISGVQLLRNRPNAAVLVETADSLAALGMGRDALVGILRQLDLSETRVASLFAD